MRDWPGQKSQVAKRLEDEVRGLLDMPGGCQITPEGSFSATCELLAERIAEALEAEHVQRRAHLYGLIGIWVDPGDRPLQRLIDEVAEILFLPRKERREYKHHSGPAQPFRIRKILLEYAMGSRQLDAILGALSKGICARCCERLPVGCCSVLGYDLGLVPDAMLTAQRIEAEGAGWTLQAGIEEKCRYHTDSGCVLGLFKSPACVGFMCTDLEKALLEDAAPQLVGAFFDALVVFRNCDIDRVAVFDAMHKAIAAGDRLVAARGQSPH